MMEDTVAAQTSQRPDDDPLQALAAVIFAAVATHAPREPDADATLRAEAARIGSEHIQLGVDAAGRRWLTLCSVLLAAYRKLLSVGEDRTTALAILQTAMTVPFRAGIHAFIRDRFGISQDAPQDAFERIAATFQSRGEQRFGRAFTFVADVGDERHSFTNITTCLFNDFFRANGVPELTAVCCALDLVWADELAQPRYGVRFERPTTLAAGDDACRFRFYRASAAAHGA
jgi:L-2-amino-thiazoline-4-carboxylic acid hydrolase-like protein